MARSDADQIQAVGRDPAALEAFYRSHVGQVTRFAARRCGNAADVADVVSATFESAITAAARYDCRKGTPIAWLLGIASHHVAALHRRVSRDVSLTRRIAGQRLLDDEDFERLEAQIEAETLAPEVAAALQAAPAGERELFLLVAYDELSPSEAARVLEISQVAARVRLSRIRRRLRAAVDPVAQARPSRTPAARVGEEI